MKTVVLMWAVLLISNSVWADATLHYELQGPDGEKRKIQISTSMIWAKIDEVGTNYSYLFKSGHQYPLYRVNHHELNYQLLTPKIKGGLNVEKNRKANNQHFSYPVITLKPTGKREMISGINCHLVHEMIDGKPLIEHCFANPARMGITVRDVKTLIRTYAILRKYRDSGWLGAGSIENDYVSVRSRHLDSTQTLQLKEVSTKPLEPKYMYIPREYTLIANTGK